jgi:hypothetical protein
MARPNTYFPLTDEIAWQKAELLGKYSIPAKP